MLVKTRKIIWRLASQTWPGQCGKIIRRRIFSSLQWINYKPGQWRGIKEIPLNFVVSSLRSSDMIHRGPRLELHGFCPLFWCLLTSHTCNNLHAYYPVSGDFLPWLSSPWRDNRYVLRIIILSCIWDVRMVDVSHNSCPCKICNTYWPNEISNLELYKTLDSMNMSLEIKNRRRLRWPGHVLRMPSDS